MHAGSNLLLNPPTISDLESHQDLPSFYKPSSQLLQSKPKFIHKSSCIFHSNSRINYYYQDCEEVVLCFDNAFSCVNTRFLSRGELYCILASFSISVSVCLQLKNTYLPAFTFTLQNTHRVKRIREKTGEFCLFSPAARNSVLFMY